MIKVSIFYPNSPGATFDMAYYIDSHLGMIKKKVATCKGTAAEQGLGGGEPGSKHTYIAIGHLLFDSVESFQAGFGPHAAEIVADVKNYTNVQPIIQISQITL
jgi:uncharacterized protein (TIGR02118 family)